MVATDGVAGMTTYRLSVTLNPNMPAGGNVYALYGNAESPIYAPPAFQAAAGANVGGVSPELFAGIPELEFDSWLTIGATDGSVDLSMGGMADEMAAWSDSVALESSNGLIFLDPTDGPSGEPWRNASPCLPCT